MKPASAYSLVRLFNNLYTYAKFDKIRQINQICEICIYVIVLN